MQKNKTREKNGRNQYIRESNLSRKLPRITKNLLRKTTYKVSHIHRLVHLHANFI